MFSVLVNNSFKENIFQWKEIGSKLNKSSALNSQNKSHIY